MTTNLKKDGDGITKVYIVSRHELGELDVILTVFNNKEAAEQNRDKRQHEQAIKDSDPETDASEKGFRYSVAAYPVWRA
jgi:hypothetical protein